MNPVKFVLAALTVVAVVVIGLLAGYQRTQIVQRGYRGLAMNELFSDSYIAKEDVINKFPKPLGPAKTDGPTAAETYENVQVLGDLSKSQFARTMLSIKQWVAPDVGCNYCHAAPVYSADDKYTKRVARKMIAMTRHINTDWKQHVGKTGVTCFTCHRGKPVPARLWFSSPTPDNGLLQHRAIMRPPTAAAAYTNLPADALTDYLLHDDPIRVNGTTALQSGNRNSVLHAKDTYTLMMVMSESLGVNCTFCHNTRAFYSWDLSTPQRATAWYGIRMVRDLNNTVMLPLKAELPANRLGPTGDVPKIYCATCHQGSNKPLYGAPMLQYYPELVRPATAANTEPASPGSPPASPAQPATGTSASTTAAPSTVPAAAVPAPARPSAGTAAVTSVAAAVTGGE
jgi:photosynthetic reaction center cytochrome c subunit